MTRKEKEQLIQAGEIIATEQKSCICLAMAMMGIDSEIWKELPEVKMIKQDVPFWWGTETMDYADNSYEAREARLLGIAMMVTMPKYMIDYNL